MISIAFWNSDVVSANWNNERLWILLHPNNGAPPSLVCWWFMLLAYSWSQILNMCPGDTAFHGKFHEIPRVVSCQHEVTKQPSVRTLMYGHLLLVTLVHLDQEMLNPYQRSPLLPLIRSREILATSCWKKCSTSKVSRGNDSPIPWNILHPEPSLTMAFLEEPPLCTTTRLIGCWSLLKCDWSKFFPTWSTSTCSQCPHEDEISGTP